MGKPRVGARTRHGGDATTTRGPMFGPSFGLLPDPADFSLPDDEPCEFGEPPPQLLSAHHRPFVNDFWRRIQRAVENPVAIDETLGIRRVQVLGQVVYDFLPDGTVSVQAWRSPPGGPTARHRIEPECIAVEHIPYRNRWLDLVAEGFRFEVQRRASAPAVILDAYTAWLFERVCRRVRHDCDVRRMRRRIAAALRLDPLAIVVAAKRLPSDRGNGIVTMADYNAVIRFNASGLVRSA